MSPCAGPKGLQGDLSGLDNLERFFQRMSADVAVQQALQVEGLA